MIQLFSVRLGAADLLRSHVTLLYSLIIYSLTSASRHFEPQVDGDAPKPRTDGELQRRFVSFVAGVFSLFGWFQARIQSTVDPGRSSCE